MAARAALLALLQAASVRAAVFDQCATVAADGSVVRLAGPNEVCACGASLPDKLYQMATLGFATYDAVAYYATGSSTGKDSIVKAAVDFAGSDSLLKDSDYTTAPDLQMYPATAAAVVPVVHLPSLDAAGASLVVDRVTLPLIFLGDIFEWTDSRILALQSPQTRALLQQMPDVTIRVVVRDDGSGTTEIFTKALSAFSSDFTARVGGNDILDWCEDGMDKLPCPGNTFTDGACDSNPDKFNCYGGKGECEGVSWLFNSGFKSSGTVTCAKASHEGRHWAYTRGAGTAGLVAAVQSLDGSIGYAVLADVNDAGLTQAMVVNRAGSALIADPETVSFALLELGGFLDERGNGELFDASSTFAYPIVGFTYYVLRKGLQDGVSHMDMAPEMFDCRTRLKTLAFLEWFYTSTAVEGMAKTLGFTNLPKFISSALLDEMLAENYCVDAETGEMRLVKARAEIQVEELYTIDFAVKALVVVTTVYKETDANVAWRIDEADASAALARGGVDTALGVAALFAADAKPTAVFSAPFMTVGFSVQYHLGTTSDVSLTHAELAAIYTCTVKTWRDLRADLPDQPIRLVVRSDECDAVDVFTAALSFHVPSFATAIGPTRALDAALLKSMGCTVVAEVQSDTQVESAITFYDFSLGWWTKTTGPSAKLASFSGDAEAAVKLDAASLRACEADPSAVLAYDTKAFNFASSVYDLSPRATGAADCWPYSRSYNMVINEQLLGPRQCEKDDKAPGQGPSQALALVRWIYAGKVFDSLEASSILSPSAEDRLKVLAVLDQFPLSYCNPATRTMAEALTLILVLTLCAAGFMVCFALCSVNLYRRRVARMLAKAQIVLPENVQELLEEVWATVRDQDGGAVADYIPELAAADPTPFAIVLCDIQSGALYEAGDATKRFTLQSACKPLLYCLALEDNGQEAVDKKVGSEPTGGPFNVVSFDTQGRPFNPYVNAGAICTTGLVAGASSEECFRRSTELFNAMSLGADCGTGLDDAVYKSEMATNANNRTIVDEALKRDLLTKGKGLFALEAYTMACSLSVDCREVAVVAATLANHGRNPKTGEQVLPEWVVKRVVSTMMTCGMYNGAGAWMVDVGIPAKSGVGGVIMCVVPGVCGFAAFSPRLDANGNSTRGVAVARGMSDKLGLHVLHQSAGKGGAKPPKKASSPGGAALSPIRKSFDVSGHGRPEAPRPALARTRSARIEPASNYAATVEGSKASQPQNGVRLAEEP